jgi:hypothetical protein
LTELQTACQAILFLTDGQADFTESDFASMLSKNSTSVTGDARKLDGKWNATQANVHLPD